MSRVPSSTTVAVLLGGWSAEREVSLSSGKACTAALERAGFKVVPIDVKRETIVADLQRVKPDVAFNALHGKWGEDGCCAAILETLQIPYTHSGVLASSLAMHKEKSKIVFRAAGVPVAESMLVPLEDVATSHPMKPPYVVKPVAEGSSVGVHIVHAGANTPVTAVLAERAIFGSHAMVERFVPGRELTCAVIGDKALGVIDIVSKGSGWYDYEAKYAPGGSQHILPAQIPADVYRKCQDYALAAHNALGCRGVSRTDFRYDDKTGDLIVLEVNTQPGMTGTSLVPELAAHAGQSYEELVTWMVNDASVDR
ncbi:D-alanine--D-alanine ligase [Aestuariivirga litoralis]|uniref:D-alanine--D-alanine ligase n=1 Tax=Aestuariivirga litoralis TaxID=2650924 RepID=A0A2W2B6P9_9HYPH|nr:D-alanine--D-alanine ligase [Aestuariivirga litoralis]PZF75994.1 D-alanine--D-alanine ligase [Aestuariivirga litoralis]